MSTLTRENLALRHFVSKEESRFTINGVLVTPERTCATNGHVLGVVPIAQERLGNRPVEVPAFTRLDKPVLLPLKSAGEVIKTLNKGRRAVALQGADGNGARAVAVRMPEGLRVTHFAQLTGTFPGIDRIIPAKDKAEYEINISTDILIQIGKCLEDMQLTRPNNCVTLRLYGANNALRLDLKTGNEQEATIILMPMRGEARGYVGNGSTSRVYGIGPETTDEFMARVRASKGGPPPATIKPWHGPQGLNAETVANKCAAVCFWQRELK